MNMRDMQKSGHSGGRKMSFAEVQEKMAAEAATKAAAEEKANGFGDGHNGSLLFGNRGLFYHMFPTKEACNENPHCQGRWVVLYCNNYIFKKRCRIWRRLLRSRPRR